MGHLDTNLERSRIFAVKDSEVSDITNVEPAF
jgi:hypothetical protein